ncbi:MAG: type II toxin-antitoxin system VapC family toxin [Armatimonadota bacterium]|nr:type II toxin-antitoxin system VapC family toxin [Armatimonadota bacterium]
MILVLDSCALIALLRREPGGELVDSILSDKDNTCIVHAVNLCEVYYDLMRAAGESRAKEVINRLVMAGVFVREDMDTDFWQDAGNMKAVHPRVSLADCFCITLANRLGVEVWTGDHHEFESVAQKKLCKVKFIR